MLLWAKRPEVLAGFPRDETGMPVRYPTSCSRQALGCGAPILALRAALGIEPDAASRTLTVAAKPGVRPADLILRGIMWLGTRWEVRVRDGQASAIPLSPARVGAPDGAG